MSKESITTSINTYIKENGNRAITGQILNSVMNEMVEGLASEEELAAKQDALTLTIKDNGNIVLGNIQGQSKEFMPATPSGDPMHYAYEAAGAEYNDTGADVVKTTPWADLADDDADKVVTHKAGYWYLNGLGDITTEKMRGIYQDRENTVINKYSLRAAKTRTNIPIRLTYQYEDLQLIGYSSSLEVASFTKDMYIRPSGLYATFRASSYLRHIINVFDFSYLTNSSSANQFLSQCNKLISVKISKIKISLALSETPLLSSKSILYMIQNEAATSAITITLHADAYARAMANADILAALQAHPNVSLASA